MFQTYPESSYQLEDHVTLKNYILGGKGIITMKSPTGKQKTYAFNKPRNEDKFDEGTIFVYRKTDTNTWLYVGMITPYFKFRLTRASTWDTDNENVNGVRYLLKVADGEIKSKMEIYHCGVCAVCGRRLTHWKSILRGVGPKCRKKLR